ncbi:MAG: response regulator [Planctomycetaceae bacterium]|nr:response regulator [Planctomycetaceae bacterium]
MMKPEAESKPQERRPVVVCIDDDPEILKSLKRLLRSDDYEVVATADPGEALDRILQPPVDVFIADQRMPGVDGTELLRVVERKSPQTRRMMISAYPEPVWRAASEPSLIQHFIPKPWNDELLKAILRRVTTPRSRKAAAPRRSSPLGLDFMKEIPLLVDCAGRYTFQINPRILKMLRKGRREGRSILAVLEGLDRLKDDPAALIADLELGVTASGVALNLVDASGLAARHLELRGNPSPLLSVWGPDATRPARSFVLVDPATPRRVFLKLLLDGLGQVCRTADNPEQGRELLQRERCDRILVDVSDPRHTMDWIEELSQLEPPISVVPLLPETRRWHPDVFDRWTLDAPLIRPYALREVLALTA